MLLNPAASSPPRSTLARGLLPTKLMRPRLSDATLARPRLEALLAAGAERRLVLIESPSGFGKTTLAAAWAQRLAAASGRVAWLTLDEYDDEPVRFMAYLWAAVQSALPTLGEAGETVDADLSMLSTSTVLSRLVHAMSEAPGTQALHLFIDGYHHLGRAPLHDAIRYLLKVAPPGFHLVLTTCAQLPFSTAPWRAAGELLDIDAGLLGFDLHETRSLWEKVAGTPPDDEALRQLHRTTGGWAAALRIAMQALGSPATPEAGALAPTGVSRHLGEYLALIWEALPVDLREFMLKTSLLDRLSAPLCEVLTGRSDAGQLLDAIARKHLLLNPLDEHGTWYGYHALMADYLRQRLQRECAPQLKPLHRKASAWFAMNAMWTQAIRHAIAAEDLEQAAAMFECCAIEKVRSGDLLTVIGWYRRFPADVTRYQPRVRLALAWAHLLAGREVEAGAMLDAVGHELAAMDNPDPAADWECGVLRGASAAVHDDSERALQLGLLGLRAPADDPWVADAAGNAVRFGHLHAANFKAALVLPWYSNGALTDVRSAYPAYFRHCFLGIASLKQLQLGEARRHIAEIDRVTQCHFGPTSFERLTGQVLAAEVLYLQGEADAARHLLSGCLALFDEAHALPPLDAAISAGRTIIRLSVLAGQADRALAQIDRAIAIGQAQQRPRLVGMGLYERFRIRLLQGDGLDAEACIERLAALAAAHPAPRRCAWSDLHDLHALSCAAWASRRGAHGEAIAWLAPRVDEARTLGYTALHVSAGVLLVQALQDSDADEAAQALLDEVLALAERADAVRAIADMALTPRLQRALHSTATASPFKRRLSDTLTPLGSVHNECPDEPRAAVSPRERDILGCIAEGLSNKEIARRLGIAPETVKTHVKRIFTKLDITRRAQAVGWLKAQ